MLGSPPARAVRRGGRSSGCPRGRSASSSASPDPLEGLYPGGCCSGSSEVARRQPSENLIIPSPPASRGPRRAIAHSAAQPRGARYPGVPHTDPPRRGCPHALAFPENTRRLTGSNRSSPFVRRLRHARLPGTCSREHSWKGDVPSGGGEREAGALQFCMQKLTATTQRKQH